MENLNNSNGKIGNNRVINDSDDHEGETIDVEEKIIESPMENGSVPERGQVTGVQEELDANSLKTTLEQLKKTDELIEIRILNTNQGVISGYFDDWDGLASQVRGHDGDYNIFMTLNPVKINLKNRGPNRLSGYAKQTTNDNEVEWIHYLLIDLDPVRPPLVSATHEEKKEAEKLKEVIKNHLKKVGILDYFEADSGNGYHLIVPVDLENTKENVKLMRACLEALDFRFSTKTVEVDRSTYNPARITKLYGTMACKGENTIERPHRRSALIFAPENPMPATREQLKDLAARLPEGIKMIPKKSGKEWDIPKFIEKHKLDLAFEKPWQGKHRIYVLGTCPWRSDHTNNSAFIIKYDNGAVAAGCHHNSCQDENWQTLKKLLGEITVMDALVENSEAKEPSKQSDVLIGLLSDCEFFHAQDEEEYVSVLIDGKRVVYKIKSKKFKQFMLKRFYESEKTSPGKDSFSQALDIAMMKASYESDEREVFKRVGVDAQETFYYDLNNEAHYVQIKKDKCSIVSDPPIIFSQSKNMGKQVMPDFEAKPEDLIELIKKHFRLKNEGDVILFAVYLISCIIPDIPHPVLTLFGEKGSSKSTNMRMMKRIIDPARQDILTMPTSREDLAIILSNHLMPCFDNMTTLSADKSNMLCMASTGGAFSKRTLYTDGDETIFEFKRCVVLNGINIVATQPDLLDRAITLELSRIDIEERLPKDQIWERFEKDLPEIMGSIFNALSGTISIRPTIELKKVGRMADFTYWGYAIGEVLGVTGEVFLDAYLENQSGANEEALASNPIATAVMAMMRRTFTWESSVTGLMRELEVTASNE